MSLTKVNYIDNSTIITAKNLNDIQDNIIQNAELINITAKNLNDIQDNTIQNAELIKKAAPRNLLDNSDFRNPVNQRGTNYYSGIGYAVDRWGLETAGSVLSINEGHITYTCESGYAGLYQILEHGDKLAGKIMTFAIKLNNTIYVETFEFRDSAGGRKLGDTGVTFYSVNGADILLRINNVGTYAYIKWTALYEGEYTLETLPEYQPKGYGVELAECKRYFRKFVYGKFAASTSAGSDINAEVFIPDCSFRVTPTINVPVYNSNYISAVFAGQSLFLTPTNIRVFSMTGSGICLQVTLPHSVGLNCAGVVNLNNCELSADL